ncbi:MAG: DUF1015 domain-containing protein [bacterium]|nr:DUF1015 domain-containing protein [bacterium]
MANIKPFKGYIYNTDKVGDRGNVISPPYYNLPHDVKKELYDMSEFNSVRLFSGMEYDTDGEHENRFTRAGTYLKNWIDNDILIRSKEPAIYMYEETIEVRGTQYQNRTFVCLLELAELSEGIVTPCEEIRTVSMQDRYDFLTHTNADLSMISCLYMEREKDLLNLMNNLAESTPNSEFDAYDGIHHRIWKITDPEKIEYISERFKDTHLYITDGQTRYETCLKYRNYMRANNPDHTGNEPYNYTMVSLINSRSDGIVIMPVHRAIKLPRGFKEDFFVAGVQDHFKIEKIIVDSQDESLTNTMKKQIATKRNDINRFAIYAGGEYFYRLTLFDKDFIKKNLLPEMSKAYCALDLVIVNKLIIEDLFRIKDEDYWDRVKYTRSTDECMQDIKNGDRDVMIVLNPVKTEQIKNVTAAGEILPRCSISVFPKPSVGVLINVKDE